MNSEEMRKAFEEWFSDGGKWPSSIERDKNGNYKYAVASNQWNVWQAALTHAQQAAPKPEVVNEDEIKQLIVKECGFDRHSNVHVIMTERTAARIANRISQGYRIVKETV